MSRPRTLPQEGIRRTITFRPDLDEELAVLAVRRRIPLSTLVDELVVQGLHPTSTGPTSTPESYAVDFPPHWDGSDLRERLYFLRMRQVDLAKALGISEATLNDRIFMRYPFSPEDIPRVQAALKAHKPKPISEFRPGSRSPKF